MYVPCLVSSTSSLCTPSPCCSSLSCPNPTPASATVSCGSWSISIDPVAPVTTTVEYILLGLVQYGRCNYKCALLTSVGIIFTPICLCDLIHLLYSSISMHSSKKGSNETHWHEDISVCIHHKQLYIHIYISKYIHYTPTLYIHYTLYTILYTIQYTIHTLLLYSTLYSIHTLYTHCTYLLYVLELDVLVLHQDDRLLQ